MRKFVLLLFLLVGCGDYEVALPNGHRLERLSRASGVITKVGKTSGSEIVSPTGIVSYQVIGDLVVGEVQIGPKDRVRWGSGNLYFLDTKSGAAFVFRNRDELLGELKKRGVSGEVTFRTVR